MKKHNKPSRTIKKSRKQTRKDMRKQKKARKHEYYTNRNKSGKYALNPSNSSVETTKIKLPVVKDNVKKTDNTDFKKNVHAKEKREQAKLQKDMAKQRKKQLHMANEDEDRNIKSLEKQLGLNKRKSKSTPKSFVEDGLDYLLEMCDSGNMKAAVAAEQQFIETNEDFEEDFALMTGKNGNNLEDDLNETFSEEEEEQEELTPKRKRIDDLNSDKNEEDHKEEDDDNFSNNSFSNDEVNLDSDLESDASNKMESEVQEETWEDIYGRLRNKDGAIIKEEGDKYVPPALRAKMQNDSINDIQKKERLNKLKRQLKGLLNRLAESNMHNIATQIENLYMNNSRNDMNNTITYLILDSIITPVLVPERLLLEHILLITILHANVGTEVGAHFLQTIIKRFQDIFQAKYPVENKMLDNIVGIIAQLYNYKVFHSQLMHEVISKLSERFTETDIECILLVLKSVGFTLRKDDPIALKNLIINLQKQSTNASTEMRENPRVKFMLDVLLAIKNNNMNKIPNYDTTYAEHLKKIMKGFVRKGCYVSTLNISLSDLLKAEEYGKWWVVGSAWSGKAVQKETQETTLKTEGYSEKLLELARKQRMNTDTRRNVFCIVMSAEDYLDAFEKLLHLGLKNQQEREIIHVLIHCCLQEKKFNPYYAVLAQKFCEHDRKYQMIIKYSVWDKLKALTECSTNQLSNLAKLLTHLFLEKGLSIATLKIVQFSELDKLSLRFIRQILIGILLCEDQNACQAVFINVAQSEKLKMFRESLKLFIQHFLVRNLKLSTISVDEKELLNERSKLIDNILEIHNKKIKL